MKRTRELLDLNLYLGPDDLWHAVPSCAICGLDIPASEPRHTAKDGSVAHERCVHKSNC